jgi:hypothetical protein
MNAFFLLIPIWAICLIMIWRNQRTADFLHHVNDLCYAYGKRNISSPGFVSAYDWFYDALPHYSKILYSFKPLKLESFATQDQINKLLS